MGPCTARSNHRCPAMLNEHDLQEFYEEQLKLYQAQRKTAKSDKARLIEEQIDLWQALILNHKKLWGLK